MCLIIFAPNIRSALIRKSVLRRGFEGNPHGSGFSYIENGELKLDKGFFTFEKFYEAYLTTRERIRSGPFLIHFRFATCGGHNKMNSQPIFSGDDLIMAHNGVFGELSFPESGISDSVLLAKTLAKMEMPFPITKPYRIILKALCADYSKLVFMNKSGKWDIINSQLGAWRAGCWYSDKGECLKREVSRGFYKSKKWRKSTRAGKENGANKKNKSVFDGSYWDSLERDSDYINCVPANRKELFTKRSGAVLAARPIYSSDFGLRPFGNPSTITKPLIMGTSMGFSD